MQPRRPSRLSRKLLEKENEHSEAKLAALKAARSAENQVWQALSSRQDSSTKGQSPIWRAASREIGGLRKFKVSSTPAQGQRAGKESSQSVAGNLCDAKAAGRREQQQEARHASTDHSECKRDREHFKESIGCHANAKTAEENVSVDVQTKARTEDPLWEKSLKKWQRDAMSYSKETTNAQGVQKCDSKETETQARLVSDETPVYVASYLDHLIFQERINHPNLGY